jgi:hypothetical protein
MWIVLDLPDSKIEHLQSHQLSWRKYRLQQWTLQSPQEHLYPLSEGLSYSYGIISFDSDFWKKWATFFQQYLCGAIIPLPLLWASFPFQKYTTKKWQIVLWKTPEEGLRYFAFFQNSLIYSRLVKEPPLNLEEEIFNLYTYLKREHGFDASSSSFLLIDFDPGAALSSFHFEQEPLLISKTVLLQQYHFSAENNLYVLHYPFIQFYKKQFSSLRLFYFYLLFLFKNYYSVLGKNLCKGIGILILYLLGRGIYFCYELKNLNHQYETLNNSPLEPEIPLILPEPLMKNLIDSAPSDVPEFAQFIEKIRSFSSPQHSIENWEWEVLGIPPQYKISLGVHLSLTPTENKKQFLKQWKNHFYPLSLTIIKKKTIKNISKENPQQWLIDIQVENPHQ